MSLAKKLSRSRINVVSTDTVGDFKFESGLSGVSVDLSAIVCVYSDQVWSVLWAPFLMYSKLK